MTVAFFILFGLSTVGLFVLGSILHVSKIEAPKPPPKLTSINPGLFL